MTVRLVHSRDGVSLRYLKSPIFLKARRKRGELNPTLVGEKKGDSRGERKRDKRSRAVISPHLQRKTIAAAIKIRIIITRR